MPGASPKAAWTGKSRRTRQCRTDRLREHRCTLSCEPARSIASRVRRPLDAPPARFRRTRMKVGFITLGCDKDTVDSERYLAQLADRGAEYTDDLADAEVIVINTCGFIDAAKK